MRVLVLALLLAGVALADGPTWELVYRSKGPPGHQGVLYCFRIIRGENSASWEEYSWGHRTESFAWSVERADNVLNGLRSRGLEYDIQPDSAGGWFAGKFVDWGETGLVGEMVNFRSANLRLSSPPVPAGNKIWQTEWHSFLMRSRPFFFPRPDESSRPPQWARLPIP